MRRFRFALRPKWFVLHIVTVVLVVTMVLLGRWQLHVSEAKHFSIQNFGYAVQWWLFSAFAAFFWGRLLRDAARRGGVLTLVPAEAAPQPAAPVAYRRYIMPTTSPGPTDPVHAAYNDYLAGLAEQDAKDAQ